MAEYFLTPEAIPAARKILVRRLSLLTLTLLISSFCYGHFVLHADFRLEIAITLLLVAIMLASYFQNFKREKLPIVSYRLLLEPGRISRFQSNLRSCA